MADWTSLCTEVSVKGPAVSVDLALRLKNFFRAHLSMKFDLLISFKLLKIANSFFSKIAEHEIFSANKYENAKYCWHFHIY